MPSPCRVAIPTGTGSNRESGLDSGHDPGGVPDQGPIEEEAFRRDLARMRGFHGARRTEVHATAHLAPARRKRPFAGARRLVAQTESRTGPAARRIPAFVAALQGE